MKSNVLKQKSLLQRENMMPSEKNFIRIGGLEETMERLTKRIDGWVMRKGCHGICRACTGAECADLYPMIDRLADHEDTGLTPEEVKALVPTPNAPLNLEELREMDGQPVWFCKCHNGLCNWCVIDHTNETNIFFTDGTVRLTSSYGDGWMAYRRRPEEGTI